jgi:hypothetical protein
MPSEREKDGDVDGGGEADNGVRGKERIEG